MRHWFQKKFLKGNPLDIQTASESRLYSFFFFQKKKVRLSAASLSGSGHMCPTSLQRNASHRQVGVCYALYHCHMEIMNSMTITESLQPLFTRRAC